MTCCTESMAVCSLPAAALRSRRGAGGEDRWHPLGRHGPPTGATGGTAGRAYREPQPWEPSPHPRPPPLLPARLAVFSPSPPPRHRPPKPPSARFNPRGGGGRGRPPAPQHPSRRIPSAGVCPPQASAATAPPRPGSHGAASLVPVPGPLR